MKRRPPIEIGEDRLTYRQGDRLPGLLLRIVDSFDVAVDLTGFTVELSTRRISGVSTRGGDWSIPRQCTIRDPLEGLIFYDMQPEDTETDPGEFELTAIIFDNDKRVATAPTRADAYLQINTNADTDLLVERLLATNLDVLFVLKDGSFLTTVGIPGTAPTPVKQSSFIV